MLTRLRRSALAALLAALAWTGSVQAAGIIRITEVMSNALTLGNMDWWELTNYGDAPIDITGWKVDDNSYSLVSAVSLVPSATGTEPAWSLIDPGESVVFMESAAAATAVVFGPTAAPEPFELRADRPFVFFIRDRETGAILFTGRVVDPRG